MGELSGYRQFNAPFTEDNQYRASNIEAVQIENLERNVRFSLKYCSTNKHYCIKNVACDKSLLNRLYGRLGHFENLTWRNASGSAREDFISIEKRDTINFKDLSSEYNDFKTFGHLRVPASNKSKFRVFGAVSDDLFYILRFDVDGKMNH